MANETTLSRSDSLQRLLEGAAGSPPPGIIPNSTSGPNFQVFNKLSMGFCVTLAAIAVLLRMYTKTFIIKSLALEDYMVVVALALQIGETNVSDIMTHHGGGSHMWDIRLETFYEMIYWAVTTAIVYGFLMIFVKLSILLQYRRIFVPTRKGNTAMYFSIHICIFCIVVFYLIVEGFAIFLCSPREKIWNKFLKGGHCYNMAATFNATGIFNVVSDFAILILPLPSIWSLQLPRKKKILVTLIFATGVFACVASIFRTYYLWKMFDSSDQSYLTGQMSLWAYVEIATGIIISCLPVTPRFFQHFAPKIRRFYGFFAVRKWSTSGTWGDSKHTDNTIPGNYLALKEQYAHKDSAKKAVGDAPRLAQPAMTRGNPNPIPSDCWDGQVV